MMPAGNRKDGRGIEDFSSRIIAVHHSSAQLLKTAWYTADSRVVVHYELLLTVV
jgi:hypothetical protein